ncbi:MAG: hypothetical protein IKK39_10820, partial [Thermoguttaceae bacterium]|nr:hypothetical protein [Thermoguttaceae bacterium]
TPTGGVVFDVDVLRSAAAIPRRTNGEASGTENGTKSAKTTDSNAEIGSREIGAPANEAGATAKAREAGKIATLLVEILARRRRGLRKSTKTDFWRN